MKILLSYISGAADRSDPYISAIPSGLCYLQAHLRNAGYEADLANFSGWNEKRISRQLKTMRPVMVGISQWTHNRHDSIRLAQLVKFVLPDTMIIIGGGHATFRYREILDNAPEVDAVVLGEGEVTLLELAERHAVGAEWHSVPGLAYREAGEIRTSPARPLISALGSLQWPSRFLEYSIGVDFSLQAGFLVSARGCPANCRFCSSPAFWKRKVRFRPPQDIVDEILYNRDRFGIIYFSLRDDTFTVDKGRTIEFCRLLMESRAGIIWNCQSRALSIDDEVAEWIKRAGCECVQLGVESGSQRILEMLEKGVLPEDVERAALSLERAGINLSVYLISDVPGETDADRKKTVDLLKRIMPDDGYVSPLAYYPGTSCFNDDVDAEKISADLFETSAETALYASAAAGTNTQNIMKALEQCARTKQHDFLKHKQVLGYCHATNVLAGEYYRVSGKNIKAAEEFEEIISREPWNPWGWYLMGELYEETGRKIEAQQCFREVLRIVPNHECRMAKCAIIKP